MSRQTSKFGCHPLWHTAVCKSPVPCWPFWHSRQWGLKCRHLSSRPSQPLWIAVRHLVNTVLVVQRSSEAATRGEMSGTELGSGHIHIGEVHKASTSSPGGISFAMALGPEPVWFFKLSRYHCSSTTLADLDWIWKIGSIFKKQIALIHTVSAW